MKSIIPALITLAAASPVAQNLDPKPTTTFSPSTLSLYYYLSGQVQYNVETGVVDRYLNSGGRDVSTLLTINFPNAWRDKQCQLTFDLGRLDKVSGSGKVQVFTSLKPAQEFQKGNNRNQYLGTLNAVYGRATWEAGSGPLAITNGVFPCSQISGISQGYELVPVGDADHIEFAKSNGIKVSVLS